MNKGRFLIESQSRQLQGKVGCCSFWSFLLYFFSHYNEVIIKFLCFSIYQFQMELEEIVALSHFVCKELDEMVRNLFKSLFNLLIYLEGLEGFTLV